MIALSIFFATNLNLISQGWNNDCPTDECLDQNNVQWSYHTTPQIPMTFNQYQSPNCWAIIIYRKRIPHENCPNQECEIEIRSVVVSGTCFYPHTDNSTTPPITYSPILDFNDNLRIWIFAINIWAQSGLEPCLTPTMGNCIRIPHLKSGNCKKLVQNANGDYELEHCESYNSCCNEIIQVCRTASGLEHSWESNEPNINNCHLNNDPNCKFTCNNYGVGGWIPPKINFNETEPNEDLLLNYNNGILNYNFHQIEYNCQVTDILGNELYIGNLTKEGQINLTKSYSKIVIVKLYNESGQRTFKFMDLK